MMLMTLSFCPVSGCMQCVGMSLFAHVVHHALAALLYDSQEEYNAMRDQWVREGDAFILIYSITTPETFQEIAGIRERILFIHDEEKVTTTHRERESETQHIVKVKRANVL